MSVLGDNIRALRKLKGRNGEELTQADIAEVAGVSRETVTKWESGAIGNIRDSNIQRLRDHYGLSIDDLRSETNGLAAKLANAGVSGRVNSISAREATVPLYSLGSVHAGSFSDECDCHVEVEIPKSVLDRHQNAFALTVEGDCMSKVVPNGSHVLVDPDMSPRNGSIAIVETQDYQAVMRRWYKFKSMLVLQSDSYADYDDIVIDDDHGPVRVLGTVVWFQASSEID